ncbi:SDR family NAD(P)-dependent oxidoreductase [Micromonospora sp. WMMD1076]|uniref:SDR family NAD(P)-dependent oxidoreductase n=1 Tax=Micromonospora TaxID=1873 RepID=UPI00249C52BF|nr:SDR family oxidoreductase [Micromonospora sp. WMMD1076]WFF04528.1 SDR family NAD(P)-dependent oxidoreductase [Micromonospora sp. WMMD1076]
MTDSSASTDRPDPPRGVVVTGGGTGIGRATAHAFADRGDKVLVVGRSEHTLAETAKGRDGIHVLPVDLADPAAPDAVVETAVREFGRLDVLVNNAATAGFDSLGGLDPAVVRAEVTTNLLAPILLTQRAVEPLAAAGGTVVNISSAGSLGLRAMPGSGVYAATKVGLDALTRTWAVELAPRGIRVVAVAPGLVDTEVAVRAGMPREAYDEFLASMLPRIPSGRVGEPEDIAWWVVTLTEAGGRYANGVVVAVDGALSVT